MIPQYPAKFFFLTFGNFKVNAIFKVFEQLLTPPVFIIDKEFKVKDKDRR